jgi:hypothetical protein
VEDDELTRARRALRGVDPELDLARVYAQSRARAHGPETHEDWASDERVEIVLHGAGTSTGAADRRARRIARRGPVLAWGAAAAAAAVVAAVSIPGLLPQGTVPGGSVPTGSVSAPTSSGRAPTGSGSPTTDTGSTPAPLPTTTAGMTPAGVVDRAAQAVAAASCGVKTRSTLGEESKTRFDQPGATDTAMPKPTPLDQQPLLVLQTSSVRAALNPADLAGTDYRLHDSLTLDEDDGAVLARIRFTPSDGLVQGGDVTRMELLIDTTTWLPHSEQTWAESAEGREYLLLSEFQWSTCDSPSPSPS